MLSTPFSGEQKYVRTQWMKQILRVNISGGEIIFGENTVYGFGVHILFLICTPFGLDILFFAS